MHPNGTYEQLKFHHTALYACQEYLCCLLFGMSLFPFTLNKLFLLIQV